MSVEGLTLGNIFDYYVRQRTEEGENRALVLGGATNTTRGHKGMDATVGTRIDQLRKKKGYSPAELARRVGTDRQRIYNWIKGENKPRRDALDKLAEVLDSTPEQILFGTPLPGKGNGVSLMTEQPASIPQDAGKLFTAVAAESLRLPARYRRALVEVLQAVRVLTEGEHAGGDS